MALRIARLIAVCAILLATWGDMPFGHAVAASPAKSPDYAIVGDWLLPWDCGEGHRVTWDPPGHWEHGKARGIAWDFSMGEGTPLYAPADGMAYFLYDERPLETNLGHYVELVVEGDWIVRLAHLRDAQTGARWVRAGDLLGYSGHSGVPVAHLHLELLVRQGESWGRPELERLDRFLGLARAVFVEDAIVTNNGCPAQVSLRGEVWPVQGRVALGNPVDLILPLSNTGLEPTTLHDIQVSLINAAGHTMLAEACGDWLLEGQRERDLVVRAWPHAAGEWRVARVTCRTNQGDVGFAAKGQVHVGASPLHVIDISSPAVLHVGERIEIGVWIENRSTQDLLLGDVRIGGAQPDGSPWKAQVDQRARVPAKQAIRLTAHSATIPQQVGTWRVTEINYQHGTGRRYDLDAPPHSWAVYGPELVVRDLVVLGSDTLFCTLDNRGTEMARVDAVETWGWRSDNAGTVAWSSQRIAPIAPGQSAYIKLDPVHAPDESLGPLVEIGYWANSSYYRMAFPERMGQWR